MTARYFYAMTSGAFVTVSLLLLMDQLIAMQPGAASDPGLAGTLTFIRIDEETDVQTLVDTSLRREAFDRPPTPPGQIAITETTSSSASGRGTRFHPVMTTTR